MVIKKLKVNKESKMDIIEPHIHMYSRTTDDYTAMHNAGFRVVVEPSFWLGSERRYAGTFFDFFRHILEFETVRAARFGIDHYAAISINPKEVEDINLANEVIEGLEEYIDHPRCVAIGEIGLNKNTEKEIIAFRKQLLMAEERRMPIIVHLPHLNKVEGTRIIVDIIKAEGVTQERIVIDHNTEDSMPISRETNCFCGLTVYPYSKLDPMRISSIIKKFGLERIIVNSSADWGVSDPLSLIKVISCLQKDGHDDTTIRKLAYDHANELYSHSVNWKPNFGLVPIPVSEYQR
ncbi:MAG: hydrolase TatD [Candidatus Brocadia sp.]|nr:hydrolase TatD [Candidatus Brocadia sp.]